MSFSILPLEVLHYLLSFIKIDDIISIISSSQDFNKLSISLLSYRIGKNFNNKTKTTKELIKLCKFSFEFMNYKEVDFKNLEIGIPVEQIRSNIKDVNNQLNKIYHTINMKYCSNQFKIFGCKMTLNQFIKFDDDGFDDDQYGKITEICNTQQYSYGPGEFDVCHTMNDESCTFIRTLLDKNSEQQMIFIDFMNKLYELSIPPLDDSKEITKFKGFKCFNKNNCFYPGNISMARAVGFYHPLYTTNYTINEKYYIFFKFSSDFHKYILYNDEYIDIKLLYNNTIEFIPILHIRLLCTDENQCRLKIEICGMNILTMTPISEHIRTL